MAAAERQEDLDMADYVSLAGVCTWYDEHGAGDPLVLLHPGGAGVDARAFVPNLGPLAAHFHVYTPELLGPRAHPGCRRSDHL